MSKKTIGLDPPFKIMHYSVHWISEFPHTKTTRKSSELIVALFPTSLSLWHHSQWNSASLEIHKDFLFIYKIDSFSSLSISFVSSYLSNQVFFFLLLLLVPSPHSPYSFVFLLLNMLTNLLLDENVDLSNEFNLLLDQSNDLQQTNLCPLYNSNITTTHNDDLTHNMVFCDKQYPQPLAPMNYTAMNCYTENNYPVMMPPESFPLPYYINNDETSHLPLQDPTNYLCASGVNPLDPNWDAINAFLAGHVHMYYRHTFDMYMIF